MNDVLSFDLGNYGEACRELLQRDEPCELGPGTPRGAVRDKLQALDHTRIFAGRQVVDRSMADCCLAGLWLLHNYLDESHQISQRVKTPSGSYWHGIMHRREPDFSNAKYWFGRVGNHPVFEPLNTAARKLAAESELDDASRYLAPQATWDPSRFVDLCEAAYRGRSSSEMLCRRIAQAEWQLLFDDCYRKALGE